MEGLLILLTIGWVIFSSITSKKRKQAQQEAQQEAQRRAQELAKTQDAPMAAPVPPQRASIDPTPDARPARTADQAGDAAFDPYFSKAPSVSKPDQTAPMRRAPIETTMRSMDSSMSSAPASRTRAAIDAQVRTTSAQHTLEASSIAGHAHTESSLSGGFGEACPPPAHQAAGRAAVSRPLVERSGTDPAIPFQWSVQDAARGMVLSEILGKPKALRKRA